MDQQHEIERLVKLIPQRVNYNSDALLQISLPTNSIVKLDDAFEIIQTDAKDKGWKPENITIIRKSGYIVCEECKRVLHIHIATDDATYCMNCEHRKIKRLTRPDIHVVD